MLEEDSLMTLSFVSGRTHTWTFSLSFVLVVHSDLISKKQSSILWRSQGRSSSSWWDHPPQSYQAQTLHLYPSGFRHFIHFKTHSYSEGSRSVVWSLAQGPDSQHFMNLQWVWMSGLLGRGCHHLHIWLRVSAIFLLQIFIILTSCPNAFTLLISISLWLGC